MILMMQETCEECEKKFFFLILHMKTHIKMQNINSGEPKTKLSVNFACFSDKCNECEKQAIRGGYLGEHERAEHEVGDQMLGALQSKF